MLYQYTGSLPVIYPAYVISGAVLIGTPGDKPVEFGDTEPPTDGRWTAVEPLAGDTLKASPAPSKPVKNAKEN